MRGGGAVALQRHVGLGRAAAEEIIPAAHHEDRHVFVILNIVDDVAELPEVVVASVLEHVDQHRFVLRHGPQRRQSAPKGHVVQVVGPVVRLALQELLHHGILRLGAAFRGVVQHPIDDPQSKRAAVDDAADAMIDRWIGGNDRRQMRRLRHGREMLGRANVGAAHHADLAVRPRLGGDPLDRVVAVRHVVAHPGPGALRVDATSRVLKDHHVAVSRVGFGCG